MSGVQYYGIDNADCMVLKTFEKRLVKKYSNRIIEI